LLPQILTVLAILNRLLLLTLLCLVSGTTVAQYRPWKYWEDQPGTLSIGFEAGATRYAGDMSEEKDLFKRPRLGAEGAFTILYRFADRFSARGDARGYFIWGKQENTRVWFNNLSFAAINPELCLGVQADLFPADQRDRPINPHFFLGLGMTYLNTFTRFQQKWITLPRWQTEGVAYNRWPAVLKLAVGHPVLTRFKYRVKAEFGYTVVFSDYLDDVSTVYPDFSKLEPLGQALSDRRSSLGLGLAAALPGDQRGNSVKRDGYFSFSLRFTKLLATDADRRYRRVIGW
jgi:hypothetical protein